MDNIKLVILDMDNTIYDYDNANKIATDFMLNTCQLYVKKNNLLQIYNESKKEINEKFKKTALSHDKMLQIKHFVEKINQTNNIINNIKLTKLLYDMYKTTFLKNLIVYDEFYSFMELLKSKNIQIVILTNNTLEIQVSIFEILELGKYVENMFTSYEIGAEKPEYCVFDYVVSKYNFNKSEIMMIGDSIDNDYTGALNYGIVPYLFNNCSYINLF